MNAPALTAAGQKVRPTPLEMKMIEQAKRSSGTIQITIWRYCFTNDDISAEVVIKGSSASRSVNAITAIIERIEATTNALLKSEGNSEGRSPVPFKFAVIGIIALKSINRAMTVEINNVIVKPNAASSGTEKLPATIIATVPIPTLQAFTKARGAASFIRSSAASLEKYKSSCSTSFRECQTLQHCHCSLIKYVNPLDAT
tara:strand:+ start:1174 stop:1773 length:600 start_codon:yes stop_codon:yes gene_type:complete